MEIHEGICSQRRDEPTLVQNRNGETQAQATFLRDFFQEEVLERSPSFEDQVHEVLAVQEVFKNGLLGQGETFFLDEQGASLTDDLICPDPIRAVFGTGSTEQALRKNFMEAPGELAFFFGYGLDQAQLPTGHEGFFQSFQIDWALGHTGAALHALPGFLQNLR